MRASAPGSSARLPRHQRRRTLCSATQQCQTCASGRPALGSGSQQGQQQREQQQRASLQDDPPAHQHVRPPRVVAAAHEPEHPGKQHAECGEHQDRHQDDQDGLEHHSLDWADAGPLQSPADRHFMPVVLTLPGGYGATFVMRNRAAIALLVCIVTAFLAPAGWSQTPAAPDTGKAAAVETTTPTGYVPPPAEPPAEAPPPGAVSPPDVPAPAAPKAIPVETTTPTGYTPPHPAAPAPAALPPAVSPADAARVLALLKNPAALADFEAKLEALTRAAAIAPPVPVAAQPAPPAPAPASGKPAAGSTLAVVPPAPAAAAPPAPASATPAAPPPQAGAAAPAQTAGKPAAPATGAAPEAEPLAAFSAVRSIPLLWGWARTMATDPLAQDLVLATAWRIVAALAAGIAVEWVVRRLIGRVVARFQARAPAAHEDRPIVGAQQDQEPADPEAAAEAGAMEADTRRRLRPTAWTLLRRMPFVLLRLLLDLLPVAAFLVAAYAASASILADGRQTRLILLAVINAYAFVAAVMAVAGTILSPEHPRLRLVHLSSEDAAYSMRWLRRIVAIAVFGYAVAAVDVLLGLSPLAQKALLKTVGFVDHVLIAVVVLQKRRAVASWIRSRTPAPNSLLAGVRSRFAATWHWVAIFFLAATWLVWAIEVPNGYAVVMRMFVSAVAVSIGARLTLIVLLGGIDRAMRPREVKGEGPRAFRERLTIYFPLVRAIVQVAVWTVALLGLMQLWGLRTLDWFVLAPLGQSIVSALVTIGVTIVVALIAWEAANARFEWHLDWLTREGQNVRAARLQTLMPMLRTALMIVIGIVAGLTVLSQIGVNIAPLLAGAGIVGVAIGFGSQKLVQDLITGIFLLLENAMQVGDWVTVSGLSGTVEHLSVRTIKLRAGDGSVHIIPFSAVTTVTNTNRGLGNAPVSVTVAFSEDVDRVCEELKAIVSGMQDDTAFGPKMLSGLELWGVDKVDGSSVTIVGQIRCTDSGRYAVQREFNKRLKQRFEELGIAIYNPSVSYMIEARHHPPEPEEPPPGAAASPEQAVQPDAIPRAAE